MFKYLVSSFDFIFILAICNAAIDMKQPLPPPKWAAVEMKQQAVDAISQWHDSFGRTYKKLSIAYNFLKSSKKVGFIGIVSIIILMNGGKSKLTYFCMYAACIFAVD